MAFSMPSMALYESLQTSTEPPCRVRRANRYEAGRSCMQASHCCYYLDLILVMMHTLQDRFSVPTVGVQNIRDT